MHSSVDGHLGCFHVLATISSAAMNTGVHVSKRIKFYKNIPSIEQAEYKWSSSPGNFILNQHRFLKYHNLLLWL